jgi:hypothetical protein
MRWAFPVVAALAAAALTGCGGSAGDLIAISTSGGGGPPYHVLVTGDGQGSCNGGKERVLPSGHVLDARDVERRLSKYAPEHASFTTGAPAGARTYTASTNDGVVTWAEGARGAPSAIAKAIVLTQELKADTCPSGF